MNVTMGGIIAQLRKENGMTQEQLANALGITFQAVSKWENGVSSPDISTLPLLAELFGVSIDRLFGREPVLVETAAPEPAQEVPGEALVPVPAETKSGAPDVDLPWPDDDTLHVVLFIGHSLVGHDSTGERLFSKKKVEFRYEGPALNVQSDFSVTVEGEVQGDVSAGGDVSCESVGGSATAGGDVSCEIVGGTVTAGGDVSCESVGGSVTAGGDVSCDAVAGDVRCEGDVNCDDVMGNLTAGGDVSCGDVGGDASASGDLRCGDVQGGASASGEEFRSNLKDKKRGFSFELKL